MNKKIIVGLSGKMFAGKDTVAGFMAEHGFKCEAFADPMREHLAILNPYLGVDFNGVPIRLNESIEKYGYSKTKVYFPEARRLMQVYGTDIIRERFRESTWCDIVARRITESASNIVLSDVRFVNEAEVVRGMGGSIVRVVRQTTKPGDHRSETELDKIEPDFIISNDSSLEALKKATFSLVEALYRL